MQNQIPFIHLFKTLRGYYIYDVNRNVILSTSESLWNYMNNNLDLSNRDIGDSLENKEASKAIDNLINNGFLSSNKVQEIIHPVDKVLEYYMNNNIYMLTLQVTQQCNLRCSYCVYSGGYNGRTHSNKKMDFEIAKKGIDYLISHSKDQKYVSIGFYGGEPLLEFDLIKKCINYTREKAQGKDIIFSITTNGTLLKDEIVEFLNTQNVSMLVSLDGPQKIQDKNRRFAFNNCGTFDKIIENLENIRDKFPEFFKKIHYNAVIDKENNFDCINSFFNDFEIIKEASIMSTGISDQYAKNDIKENDLFYETYSYEYFKFLLHKLGRIDNKYTSKIVKKDFDGLQRLYRKLKPVEKLPKKAHHGGPCIPGAQRLFMDVEGNLYPCERVSEYSEPMRIGNIHDGLNLNKVRKILNFGKISEDRCKNCWVIRFCYLCAATADDLSDFSDSKKVKKCFSVKRGIENQLKDICVLKEYGYNFDNENFDVSLLKMEELI